MTSQEAQAQQELRQQSVENVTPIKDKLYPNILICGASGTGKSTSLRNLNPETTLVINTERKVLPFRAARNFTKQKNVHSLAQFNGLLNKAIERDDIEVIVIDSFTSLAEIVYSEFVMNVEKVGDSVMVAWSQYKDTLHQILLRSKAANKFVVFLAVEDLIQDDMQRISKTVAVQGGLRGKVAKEFEMVLWTKIVEHDESSQQYKFVTNGDPQNESKTPFEMFDDRMIENDLNKVLETAFDYFNN